MIQVGVLKKTVAAIGFLVLLLLFTACGSGDGSSVSTPHSDSGVSQVTVEEPLPVSFTLENQTGFDIYELQISAENYDNWQPNLLAEVLADGQTVSIDFEPNTPSLLWDLRVIDSEGFSVRYNGLDLLNCSELSLQISAGVPQAVVK
jgi:hypothetical protein